MDAEFNEYAAELLDSAGVLVFGRVTYQVMADYWPTPAARENDPVIAAKMNELPKIVFSKTLKNVDWQNSRLEKNNIIEVLMELKHVPGNNIIVGGSDLSLTLLKNKLIDELRILVNPIILGGGKTLFQGIGERYNLKLLKTRTFHSGVVALHYQLN